MRVKGLRMEDKTSGLTSSRPGRPFPSSSCRPRVSVCLLAATVLGPPSPVPLGPAIVFESRGLELDTFRTVGVGDDAKSDRSGEAGGGEERGMVDRAQCG